MRNPITITVTIQIAGKRDLEIVLKNIDYSDSSPSENDNEGGLPEIVGSSR